MKFHVTNSNNIFCYNMVMHIKVWHIGSRYTDYCPLIDIISMVLVPTESLLDKEYIEFHETLKQNIRWGDALEYSL